MPGESNVACAARVIHFVRTALLLKSANDNKENKIQVKIKIDPHTLERAEERGATEEEIIDVIRSGVPITSKTWKDG
jgi:hypothetical protein